MKMLFNIKWLSILNHANLHNKAPKLIYKRFLIFQILWMIVTGNKSLFAFFYHNLLSEKL